MKKKALSFYYITLMLICQCFICLGAGLTAKAASVNDFYFDDFTGDYYLSRDEEGVSHLRVKESVTAVFPEYKQNKGICRQIAFTNQNGANVTLPSLTRTNIAVTRNGVSEPIYSIEKENGYYNVCTGTDEYVLGRQVYVFEYEFERVVTDFGDYQELYWDTNGNGAMQKFNKVTARVHFADDVVNDYAGKSWCYVGKYGESGQDRCAISATSDGVKFEAENLKAYENLTFDVELMAGSFVVPEPEHNYTLVMIMVLGGVACGLLLIVPIRKFRKVADKRKFYKGYFVKPEYQSPKDFTVAEMAELYIGKKKDAKVAVLLDLIVRRKIALKKEGESKKKGWKVIVKSLDGVREEGKDILRILNGGGLVGEGNEIEIKTRPATTKLVELGRDYDRAVRAELKNDGLVENDYRGSGGSPVLVVIIIALVFLAPTLVSMLEVLGDMASSGQLTGYVVGKDWFMPVLIVEAAVLILVWNILSSQTRDFAARTKYGLEMSRYMDGLKLYIGMAEAERLKFLQSVEGADTSNEGIVNLYEKLLPYAAVLGLEKSWMKELEKYYKLDDVAEPEWYRYGWTMHDMYVVSSLMSQTVRVSTTMASSGGSSSSGFSGGGGGGFSGGGGGGGGFSGR